MNERGESEEASLDVSRYFAYVCIVSQKLNPDKLSQVVTRLREMKGLTFAINGKILRADSAPSHVQRQVGFISLESPHVHIVNVCH